MKNSIQFRKYFLVLCTIAANISFISIAGPTEHDDDLEGFTEVSAGEYNEFYPIATPYAPWNFEIVNKFPEAITVMVYQGGQAILNGGMPVTIMGATRQQSGFFRTSVINPMLPVTIEIAGSGPPGNYVINPPHYNNNTTFFLIWDGRTPLRPQQAGTYFGRNTESGLSLKNNIKTQDIHIVE